MIITADARLDNRQELFDCLGPFTHPLHEVADSELLVAAYRRWGKLSAKYLLGDFSYFIWDEGAERVVCARDQLGIKILYFYNSDLGLVIANHLHGVIAPDFVPESISEQAVAFYFRDGELRDQNSTFFQSVYKLQPGSVLVANCGEVKIERYWRPEQVPKLKNGSTSEYADLLVDILGRAVNDRLRTDYGVASHLSGGLDSSAIVSIASDLLSQRDRTLHTFDWNPCPEVESPEILGQDLVDELPNGSHVSHMHLDIRRARLSKNLSNHDLTSGDTATTWYEPMVIDKCKSVGARVILSGWGGDQFITNHGDYAVVEIFKRDGLLKTLKMVFCAAKRANHPIRRFLSIIFWQIIQVQLPERLAHPSVRSYWKREDYTACASAKIKQLLSEQGCASTFRRFSTVMEDQVDHYYSGYLHSRLEAWHALGIENGIEYRFPLIDRRLVEFALSLSPEMFWKNGISRYLFRHAVEDILPSGICWGKPNFETHRVEQLEDELYRSVLDWLTNHLDEHKGNSPASKFVDIDSIELFLGSGDEGSIGWDENSRATLSVVKAILVMSSIDRQRGLDIV